jgi:hypothetical protein
MARKAYRCDSCGRRRVGVTVVGRLDLCPECAEKGAEARAAAEAVDRIRVEAGVCRHCGGPVPCWSPHGDVEVGVRRGR